MVSQAFEGLDREKRGFLTAEGIKQVVGLDFDGDEVRYMASFAAPFECLGEEIIERLMSRYLVHDGGKWDTAGLTGMEASKKEINKWTGIVSSGDVGVYFRKG